MLYRTIRRPRIWLLGLLSLVTLGIISACSPNPTILTNSLAPTNNVLKSNSAKAFEFNMVPSSPAIKACLPNAKGHVDITPGVNNDELKISVSGLAPNTGFALFVIEIPNSPFGVAWYQTDMTTDSKGSGSATVRGILDVETFSLSLGGPTTTFKPTHQYHLGLWFGDPNTPFKLGCEPGAKKPIVTPFDGDQVAGVQVLNTSNFPNNAGPLSKAHR